MLILLPPSEGKAQPADGARCALSSLSFDEELRPTRTKLWRAQPAAVKRAATGPAHSVYSGVLYAALDYSTLQAKARRNADASIVVVSALFGALRLQDCIPAYKATMSTAAWKEPLTQALTSLTDVGVTIDCRSSTYTAVFAPPQKRTVAVRVFRQSGKTRTVITHMSKHYRGLVARLLCDAPRAAKSPEAVAQLVSTQWSCELHSPKDGHSWLLDLIVKD